MDISENTRSRVARRAWVAMFILLGLVVACGLGAVIRGQIFPPVARQPSWLLPGAKLRFHMPAGCYDCSGERYVSHGLAVTQLDSLADLKGLVRIENAEDALSFCRFGDDDPALPLKGPRHAELSHGVGYGGSSGTSVAERQWLANHLSDPSVKWTGAAWIVTRTAIVDGPGYKAIPAVLTESVGKDGSYAIVKTVTIKIKLGK